MQVLEQELHKDQAEKPASSSEQDRWGNMEEKWKDEVYCQRKQSVLAKTAQNPQQSLDFYWLLYKKKKRKNNKGLGSNYLVKVVLELDQ